MENFKGREDVLTFREALVDIPNQTCHIYFVLKISVQLGVMAFSRILLIVGSTVMGIIQQSHCKFIHESTSGSEKSKKYLHHFKYFMVTSSYFFIKV